MLGIQTLVRRIVGSDDTTELWQPPNLDILLQMKKHCFENDKSKSRTTINQRVSFVRNRHHIIIVIRILLFQVKNKLIFHFFLLFRVSPKWLPVSITE